jgi:hypothetical protein
MLSGDAKCVGADEVRDRSATDGATVSSAPPTPVAALSGCPCTKGHYVGGDVLDPHSYVWTWALDGREHTLAERPVNADDRLLRDWAGSDPRKRNLARNMASAWGINLQF